MSPDPTPTKRQRIGDLATDSSARMSSRGKPRQQPPPSDPTTLDSSSSASATPCMAMFQTFRTELDTHHDRRERVIKASRDITATAKKIIFTLQRVPSSSTGSGSVPVSSLPGPASSKLPENLATDIAVKETAIATLLASVFPSDLAGLNAWRYQRQFSPGMQELMEAYVFRHYLEKGRIPAFEEARGWIAGLFLLLGRKGKGDEGTMGGEMGEGEDGCEAALAAMAAASQLLTEDDFLLGIFDAVGEMMRWGITGLALHRGVGGNHGDQSLIQDLRALRLELEGLRVYGSSVQREVEKKMDVMRACVEKVENAVYGMVVRGSERPEGWVPEDSNAGGNRREEVEGY